jgi:DnaJ-class molecular chaperone
MANTNINKNRNTINVNVRTGSIQRGSNTRSCAACRGTGYSDGPVQLKRCSVCGGKGVVRV